MYWVSPTKNYISEIFITVLLSKYLKDGYFNSPKVRHTATNCQSTTELLTKKVTQTVTKPVVIQPMSP